MPTAFLLIAALWPLTTRPAIAENQGPRVEEHGKATYYSDKFNGRETASGAMMNQKAMTAASPNLPLGTKAKVTNMKTGKSVDVKINDRSPPRKSHVIDLSKRAAADLGIDHHDGTAPVKVEEKTAEQPTPELKARVAERASKNKSAGGN
jgi:rare lipoprotein A